MAYMDLHAVERLLSALDHSTAYLKALDVDCPHYYPFSFWSDTCKHSFHSIWNTPTLSTSPLAPHSTRSYRIPAASSMLVPDPATGTPPGLRPQPLPAAHLALARAAIRVLRVCAPPSDRVGADGGIVSDRRKHVER